MTAFDRFERALRHFEAAVGRTHQTEKRAETLASEAEALRRDRLRLAHERDVRRRGSAAAANNIYKAFPGPSFNKMGCFMRLFIILAHCIRQSGIGISRSIATGYL